MIFFAAISIRVLELAKGYRGGRSKLIKEATTAVMHAGADAYRGRKQKKDVFWIVLSRPMLQVRSLAPSESGTLPQIPLLGTTGCRTSLKSARFFGFSLRRADEEPGKKRRAGGGRLERFPRDLGAGQDQCLP